MFSFCSHIGLITFCGLLIILLLCRLASFSVCRSRQNIIAIANIYRTVDLGSHLHDSLLQTIVISGPCVPINSWLEFLNSQEESVFVTVSKRSVSTSKIPTVEVRIMTVSIPPTTFIQSSTGALGKVSFSVVIVNIKCGKRKSVVAKIDLKVRKAYLKSWDETVYKFYSTMNILRIKCSVGE